MEGELNLSAHELHLVHVYEKVHIEGHKNNIVSGRARSLANIIMTKAPSIASHLMELANDLSVDYQATDFTLALMGD